MPTKDTLDTSSYQPDQEVLDRWPGVSGNDINGVGEAEVRQPRPVFWRTDGSIVHGPLMYLFFERGLQVPEIDAARTRVDQFANAAISDIPPESETQAAEDWTAQVKAQALEIGADDVGIAAFRPEWAFEDRPMPQGQYAVVMAFKHEYEELETAPGPAALVEVLNQYGRAGDASIDLANWIREKGHFAAAKTGPKTDDVLMIPAAIEAGLGELGKHGSIIHPRFGSNFRLSMVLTDMPLVEDSPVVFGADDFCTSCQVCTNACPPDAITPDKHLVRGTTKWYVDFDKCLPYFIDHEGCGICLAVCPWSRPGVADNLLEKMARRRNERG